MDKEYLYTSQQKLVLKISNINIHMNLTRHHFFKLGELSFLLGRIVIDGR